MHDRAVFRRRRDDLYRAQPREGAATSVSFGWDAFDKPPPQSFKVQSRSFQHLSRLRRNVRVFTGGSGSMDISRALDKD